VNERKAMINRESKPSIAKQCKLLDISRSGFYYQPAPVSAVELEQMRLIDEGHMKHPYFGSRRPVSYTNLRARETKANIEFLHHLETKIISIKNQKTHPSTLINLQRN